MNTSIYLKKENLKDTTSSILIIYALKKVMMFFHMLNFLVGCSTFAGRMFNFCRADVQLFGRMFNFCRADGQFYNNFSFCLLLLFTYSCIGIA